MVNLIEVFYGRQNKCSEEIYKLFPPDQRLWAGALPAAPTKYIAQEQVFLSVS